LARRGNLAGDLDGGVVGRFHVDVDEGLQKDVVSPMLVQQRRVGTPRRKHVMDRRQFVEVDLDGGGDILGLGPRIGHARGDEFAHLTHLVDGQHRLLRHLEPGKRRHRHDRLHILQVGCRIDAIAVDFRHPDLAHLRMRKRRAEEGDILHAGQTDIGHILAAPAKETIVLLARQRGADALFRHSRPLPHHPANRRRPGETGVRLFTRSSITSHIILFPV